MERIARIIRARKQDTLELRRGEEAIMCYEEWYEVIGVGSGRINCS